ncbi:hypothetical protein C0J52_17644 [Blattella germanica]|nr:hypothetical protein C0J52_17644 [Blattella germanica]
MATKKSLSETFMDLINPAPLSFDPEDDEPESTAKIVENEESVSEEESAPSALRKRKFDFLEDGDERYDGTKVSRKSLNMEEHDSDSEVDIRNSADETEESENESNEEDIENSENEDSSQDKSEAESEDDRFEVASEDGFKHISNTNSELEIEKSIAVKNQLNLWDNLLECRITLQKSLSAANKLPQCSTFQQFTSSGGSKFITETLLGDQHNKYKDFWNAVIQKWNDKTRMSVGKLSSQNFSNFEQSTLKQIEQVLSNRQRLIQRTQLKRSSYNILGEDLSDGQRDQDAERRKIRYVVHSKLVNFMAPEDKGVYTEEAKTELFNSLFGNNRR